MEQANKDMNDFIKVVIKQFVVLEELVYFGSKPALPNRIKEMVEQDTSNQEFLFIMIKVLLLLYCAKEDILNVAKETIHGDTYDRFEDLVKRINAKNDEEFSVPLTS